MKKRIMLTLVVFLSAVYGHAFGGIVTTAKSEISVQPAAAEVGKSKSTESTQLERGR